MRQSSYRGQSHRPKQFHSDRRSHEGPHSVGMTAPSDTQSISRGRFLSQGRSSAPHQFHGEQCVNHTHTPTSTAHANAPRLSEKVQEELQAAGKCFICKETGHLLQKCPKRNIVCSSSQQPLGTAAFNLELGPIINSNMDNSVEVLESLLVGAIYFDTQDQNSAAPILPYPLDEWQEHYPYWKESNIYPRQTIGDCYAMQADAILTLEQPYPGDDRYDSSQVRPEWQFTVKGTCVNDDYMIYDSLTKFQISINKSYLSNHQFDLAQWYA